MSKFVSISVAAKTLGVSTSICADGCQRPEHAGQHIGAELVFAICQANEVEVVIMNQGEDTRFEEDLASDVLEIMTVFSARLYGSRSRKNQKLIDGVHATVREAQC